MDGSNREMSLDEWCGRLPNFHRVNKELSTLRAENERLLKRVDELESAIEIEVAYPIDADGNVNRSRPYCYHCGTQVRDQKYCHICGRKLVW